MAKEALILLCAFLTLASSNVIQPYDLAEEAEELMQQLISLVQGRILIADDDIQDLYSDFRSFSRDEADYAEISISQQHQTVTGEISQIKNLAETAGRDVTSCTQIRENTIQQLVTTYNDQISQCVADVLTEGLKVTRDAKYYVDIIMNKVHNVENQLKSCNGDLLCIAPLVEQIELYQIDFIQEIREEVSKVDELLALLKVQSTGCADEGVSSYVAETNAILQDLTDCVNAILG